VDTEHMERCTPAHFRVPIRHMFAARMRFITVTLNILLSI